MWWQVCSHLHSSCPPCLLLLQHPGLHDCHFYWGLLRSTLSKSERKINCSYCLLKSYQLAVKTAQAQYSLRSLIISIIILTYFQCSQFHHPLNSHSMFWSVRISDFLFSFFGDNVTSFHWEHTVQNFFHSISPLVQHIISSLKTFVSSADIIPTELFKQVIGTTGCSNLSII